MSPSRCAGLPMTPMAFAIQARAFGSASGSPRREPSSLA